MACVVLVPIVLGEPPVHYGVPAFSGFSSSGGGGGGGYHATSLGHQTNEGLHVDPHLLHQIKGILIDHEAQEEQYRHHSYSPSPVYGVPHHHHHYDRVAGIEFGGVRPAIQVAQFHQQSHEYNNFGGDHGLSHGYALPVASFRPPALAYGPPSLSYGAPSPRYHH